MGRGYHYSTTPYMTVISLYLRARQGSKQKTKTVLWQSKGHIIPIWKSFTVRSNLYHPCLLVPLLYSWSRVFPKSELSDGSFHFPCKNSSFLTLYQFTSLKAIAMCVVNASRGKFSWRRNKKKHCVDLFSFLSRLEAYATSTFGRHSFVREKSFFT